MVTKEQIDRALASEIPLEDYAPRLKLKQALNKLAEGHFDEQLFKELYMACNEYNDSVRVQEFSQKVFEAYQILNQRVKTESSNLLTLEREFNAMSPQDVAQKPRRNALQLRINDTKAQIAGYKDQINFINKAFAHGSASLPRQQSGSLDAGLGQSNTVNMLRALLFIVLASLLFQISKGFGQPNFLSLIDLATIFSMFVANYLDKMHMRVCLSINFASIVLDIVWLSAYFGTWSSPPAVSALYAGLKSGYMYACVMTIILLLAKTTIQVLLFLCKDYQEQQMVIRLLFGVEFPVGGITSPVTQAMRRAQGKSLEGQNLAARQSGSV